MAYLELSSNPLANHRPASGWPAEPRHLSALEWSVVALARREHPASLREPGRLGRALRRLFGFATAARLADPRLEALRRLAIHAWHYGYRLPVSELKAFVASGFSTDQLDTVLASIAVARGAASRSGAA